MNKTTKTWLAMGVLILIAISAAGYIYFWQIWWPVKQVLIVQGLASVDFPWRNYSPAELNKMYPQIKNVDVPTRVTPEETYAKFREALRTNNLALALEQLAVESKKDKETADSLKKFYNENKFGELYLYYPEKIQKESMGESIASFYYLEMKAGRNLRQSIEFTKDANGDWKMDSL